MRLIGNATSDIADEVRYVGAERTTPLTSQRRSTGWPVIAGYHTFIPFVLPGETPLSGCPI